MDSSRDQLLHLCWLRAIEVAIHAGFTQSILLHQVFNTHASSPLLTQGRDLGRGEGMLPAEAHASCQGFLNALHLPLRPQLRLKLGNRTQHIEEQAAGGIRDINILVKHTLRDIATRGEHRQLPLRGLEAHQGADYLLLPQELVCGITGIPRPALAPLRVARPAQGSFPLGFSPLCSEREPALASGGRTVTPQLRFIGGGSPRAPSAS
jgi:hypothetical protein